MKAARIHQHGGPEVLKYEDVPDPQIKANQIIVRVQPGWRVLLSPGQSCRQCQQCVSGLDNYCRKYTMFGYGVDGGDCEMLAAPEYTAIPIPDDMSFEDA